MRKMHIALMLQNLSDEEILLTCSTSPSAEAPDFVDNQRRQWDYLIQHPDWSESFPFKRPRIFQRTEDKSWQNFAAHLMHTLIKSVSFKGPARGKGKLARVLWLKQLSEELCFCGEVTAKKTWPLNAVLIIKSLK